MAIPRTARWQADLSGIWQAMNTAAWDIQAHAAQKGVPGGPESSKARDSYQPGAGRKHRTTNSAPRWHEAILPAGHSGLNYTPFPFQIVQTPDKSWAVRVRACRSVHLHEGTHPPVPSTVARDSRARWEGDTLVVDVVHFNDQNWFDRAGNFHSEALHLIERFTPIGPDHIQYNVTVEDPKVFTRPWNMSMILYRHKEKLMQLFDYECYAFDVQHLYPYPEMRVPR